MGRARSRHRVRQVRIIGGNWKGRKLPVPAGVRPTPDRAKVTVFNWLASALPGAQVLDAFAGTGALGLEAVSRGAAHATLVEKDRATAHLLTQSQTDLGMEDVTVTHASALDWLERQPPAARWDIVFLDPPFHADLLAAALRAVAPRLRQGAVVYVECGLERGLASLAAEFNVYRESTAGTARYGLLKLGASRDDGRAA